MVQPGVLFQSACPWLSSRSRTRKRLNNPCFLILLLFLAAGRLPAQVVAGPVINPSNGHAYWLLAPDSWTHSEAQAVALGGHLATINDQAEQDWVVAQFGQYAGEYRSSGSDSVRRRPRSPRVLSAGSAGNRRHTRTGPAPSQMILRNPRRRHCMSVSILWSTPSTRGSGTTGPTPGRLRVIPAGRTPAVWSRRRSWNPSLDSRSRRPARPSINPCLSWIPPPVLRRAGCGTSAIRAALRIRAPSTRTRPRAVSP